MSSYDLFRSRTNIEQTVSSAATNDFIYSSKSSREIFHTRLDMTKTAVFTNHYKEGTDEWILFTALEVAADNNIKIGDYIEVDNVIYLVYEEYNHPQKTHYLKHRVIECNVEFKLDDIAQYAAYIGSLRSNMDLIAKSSGDMSLMVDSIKPMLITSNNSSVIVGDRVMINTSDALEITQVDRISNSGIMYMSVKTAPINSYYDDLVVGAAKKAPVASNPIPALTFRSGIEATVSTNSAYAVFSEPVEIVSKTVDEIVFICPFGINTINITTKNSSGFEVTTTYGVM